ncbi:MULTISPECIES: Imm26 family immunity protein [unclassified Microbacterium]|uniref:Imm26 family immunity protein n=1 Tax=unclassified Microbacterium TaxID=2609290 RepID=UPI0012F8D1C8|nr:Imm26 family immunity protein [Microbacterium sp. MAH-37]MVQ41416.1 hypothetical protein [Microbacterium sp. MAH-37]
MTTINYSEGDWYAVPIGEKSYGIGLVARLSGTGEVLSYFFGPRCDEVPTLDDVAGYDPSDAVLVGHHGDLSLLDSRWPILGKLPGWDRNLWPMPVFLRRETLSGRVFKVFYDADDPSRWIGDARTSDDAEGPEDGLMGAGFVEARLSRLLK